MPHLPASPPAHTHPHVLLPLLAGLLAAGGASSALAQEEQGRVISTVAVVQPVAVPRQVCTEQLVTVPGQKSGAGALIGGIAGGAMGNAVGDGSGRALATAIGLIGGAIVGDRIEGGQPSETRTVQQCSTQTFYENRTVAYDVTYEYAGRQYRTQMPQDPGPFVRLSVTPVPSAAPPVQYAPAPAPYTPPPPVQYLPAQPRVHYLPTQPRVEYVPVAPVVTRVQIGTHWVPGPRVVYTPDRPARLHPDHQRRHDWRDDRYGRGHERRSPHDGERWGRP